MEDSSSALADIMETVTIGDAATFYPFPGLPFEFRDKIWRFAVASPRLITIKQIGRIDCYKDIRQRTSFVDLNDGKFGLLHACAESKRIVQKTRPLIFPTAKSEGLYADLTKDILYFSEELVSDDFRLTFFLHNFQKYKNTIRYLAVQDTILYCKWTSSNLADMKALRTFFLIHDQTPTSYVAKVSIESLNLFKYKRGYTGKDFMDDMRGTPREDDRHCLQFATGIIVGDGTVEVISEESEKEGRISLTMERQDEVRKALKAKAVGETAVEEMSIVKSLGQTMCVVDAI